MHNADPGKKTLSNFWGNLSYKTLYWPIKYMQVHIIGYPEGIIHSTFLILRQRIKTITASTTFQSSRQ